MKNFTTKKSLVICAILFFINGYTYCQPWRFYPSGTCNDNSVVTDNPSYKISFVGIGDYVINNDCPSAALDICIPYLFNKGLAAGGEAIHTSADGKADHAWRMYTFDGSSHYPHPGCEKFHIINYEGKCDASYGRNNSVELSVVQDGDLELFTNSKHWARLRDMGNFGLSSYDTWGSFTPHSLLHLNQNGYTDVLSQYTNENTTWGDNTKGFSMGIRNYNNYPGAMKAFAELIQHENAPMRLFTTDVNRMIINANFSPTINNVLVNTNGYVGIGNNAHWNEENGGLGPHSLLHLQGPSNSGFSSMGWRTWDKTGIYINENSDQMYVGLKDESVTYGVNHSDAVIAWGDDQSGSGIDNFRLIFSGQAASGNGNNTNILDPSSKNGFETMRMTPFGYMGLGPTFNLNLPPARRLEVLDVINMTSGLSINEPQLRLSCTQATAGSLNTTGKWTDFQTTILGDLYLHPFSSFNGGDRKVGINTITPLTTLHVGGTSGSNNGQITSDWLNHSYHPIPTPPGSNPWLVYSDQFGTLQNLAPAPHTTDVLHGDGSWSAAGAGNLTACSTATANAITLFDSPTSVCNSDMYDDLPNHRMSIATPLYITPRRTLDIRGNVPPPPPPTSPVTGGLGIQSSVWYQDIRILAVDGMAWPGGANEIGLTGQNLYLGENAGNTGPPSTFGTGQDNSHIANVRYGNTALGHFALSNLNPGSLSVHEAENNTAVGLSSGWSVTTGRDNVLVGVASGYRTTTGNSNVFIGTQAGDKNQAGTENIVIGIDAGFNGDHTTGAPSTGTTIGNQNVIIGQSAGQNNVSDWNVMIGNGSGRTLNNVSSVNNVFLGNNTDIPTSGDHYEGINLLGANSTAILPAGHHTIVNASAIGVNSRVESDNTMVLGASIPSSLFDTRVLMGFTAVPATVTTGGTSPHTSNNCRLYVRHDDGQQDAAFFEGNILVAGSVFDASDAALKKDIRTLEKSSVEQIVDQLEPKTYKFDQSQGFTLPEEDQFGFIAQDLEKILPNLVRNVVTPPLSNEKGEIIREERTIKTINYAGLIPILFQSMKDQKEEIKELKSMINDCCKTGSNNRLANPSIDVELSNSIILNQNDPNPFAEETRITFNIPESVIEAKIIFTDNSNHIIQTVIINERGEGQLNVYSSKLSSGIYTYTLIADGKVIDSKKMVCSK